MSKKEISPKKRYVLRTLAMAESDPELRGLKPNPDLRKQALAEQLSYDQVIGLHLDAYSQRPALADRKYEVKKDKKTGKQIRNYLKEFQTITYGDLHTRIKAIAMAFRNHPFCRLDRDEFMMIMGCLLYTSPSPRD